MFQQGDFPNLIAGLDSPDDAAVYRLDDQRVLIATNDFFTPVVDDPYDYGFIAATNSLSDVYAMGGKPLLALSIVALPMNLPMEMSTEIMRGLGEAVHQAGSVIAGGHSVQDKEPKVGLCVIADGHPDTVMAKGGARVGDVLVLTKPLGNGILATAGKKEKADPAHMQNAVSWMKRLNRSASEVAVSVGVRAATDITGFGLLGHSWEMASSAKVGFRFFVDKLPFLDGFHAYAGQGLVPGGAKANRSTYEPHVRYGPDVTEVEHLLVSDPQTSGGLLLAVPAEKVSEFEKRMSEREEAYWVVGEVVEGEGLEIVRGN